MTETSPMPSPDRAASAFLSAGRTSGPDIWAEAGTALETAYRTRRPVGSTPWLLIILLSFAIATACIGQLVA